MKASHLENLLTRYGQHMMLAGIHKQKSRQYTKEIANQILSDYRKEEALAKMVREEIVVCVLQSTK